MQNHNIDDIFRQGLNDLESTPSTKVWQGVEQGLSPKWYSWTSVKSIIVGAAIVSTSALIWYLNSNQESVVLPQNNPVSQEKQATVTNQETNNTTSSSQNNDVNTSNETDKAKNNKEQEAGKTGNTGNENSNAAKNNSAAGMGNNPGANPNVPAPGNNPSSSPTTTPSEPKSVLAFDWKLYDSLVCPSEAINLVINHNADKVTVLFGDGNSESSDLKNAQFRHNYSKEGKYTLRVIATLGLRVKQFTKHIEVSRPKASFTVSPGSKNGIFKFTNTSVNADKFQWYFNDQSNTSLSNMRSPEHGFIGEKSEYEVMLVAMNSGHSCSDTFRYLVKTVQAAKPTTAAAEVNTFTPNGDGINDKFEIPRIPASSINFIVVDQNGDKVFESDDQANGWDGMNQVTKRPAPEGQYRYYLRYSENGQQLNKSGFITLIR